MQHTIAQRLGHYVAHEKLNTLPDDVIEKANDCLVDAIGCLLGAYALPFAVILDQYLLDCGSRGNARIVGSHRRADPGMAAYIQASLINALDFDDIYRKGHPGATVVAAALSVGSHAESDGADVLEAMVVGYEVSGRVAMSLSHLHPRKTIHGHGTWQALGAAATAAKILKLDASQVAHALAIAAVNAPVASVMKTVYGAVPTMAKNNFGTAAQTGVNAAFLAKNGFEGPLDIFEGDCGFWRMAGADACDSEQLTAGLGRDYEIREVGFKPHSCCRILQSSIQASVSVFAIAGVNPRDLAHHTLTVTAPQIVCEPPFSSHAPVDIWAAQFSAPYTITMALLGINPGPEWFSEESIHDKAAASFMAGIKLLPDTARSGSHHRARAQLHLKTGVIFNAEVGIALGEAANPLPRSFLRGKFLNLAEKRLGADRALALLETLDGLRTLSSVSLLIAESIPVDLMLTGLQEGSCGGHCGRVCKTPL